MPLPDAKHICAAILEADASVAAITDRIGTRNFDALPFVRLTATGGVSVVPEALQAPTVQVDCWAADEGEAADLASECFAALIGARGAVYPGGVVTAITPVALPIDDQDEETRAWRQLFTVRVYARHSAA